LSEIRLCEEIVRLGSEREGEVKVLYVAYTYWTHELPYSWRFG